MIVYVLDHDEVDVEGVDLIELRPDHSPLTSHLQPYLLTRQAPNAGASYVDIPYPESITQLRREYPDSRWIRSFHGPYISVEITTNLIKEMMQEGPDLVKICFDALPISAFLSLTSLFSLYPEKLILFGCGERGQSTRLLSYCLGAPWIYTSKKGFCGQIPLEELLNTYQICRLSRKTAFYGLIKGVESPPSIGYQLYNPLFARQNLDALYMNLILDEEEVATVFSSPLFSGFSITMPFKERCFALAKNLSLEAKECGAINTYTQETGYNTDIEILKELEVVGKKVAILGGGGVAKAFANYLKRNNQVTVFLRNSQKAELFQNAVGVDVASLTEPAGEYDFCIDTLPVAPPFSWQKNPPTILDMKISSESGKRVFVAQGAKQLEIFFGIEFFFN